MTFEPTVPYCGQCGWDASNQDWLADLICDSCGADLSLYGFVPPPPPVGTHFVFNGVNGNYLTTPHTVDLDFVNEFSMQLDVAFTSWALSTNYSLITMQPSANVGPLLAYSTSEALGVRVEMSNGNYGGVGDNLSSIPDNERHVIATVVSITDWLFTLDGASAGSAAPFGDSPMVNSEAPVILGASEAFTQVMKGQLYSAQIFSVASVAGVAALDMNAADAALPIGPVADGTVFTSNGRIWTVRGSNVEYA